MILSTTHCLMVLATFALGIVPPQPGNVQKDEIKPTGEYAKIDVRLTNDTMKVLLDGNRQEKQAAVKQILAAPDKYAPVVFCAMSNVLFGEGKKDEAAFWFFAGMLRSRFDARRCADETAREGVAVLNQRYGPPIIQYSLQNPAKFEALIAKVVEWDRKTPYNYDHRWINLHGMAAIMESTGMNDASGKHPPLSLPKDQWKQLAEKTRAEYVEGIHKAVLEEMKNRPVDAKQPAEKTF